MAAQQTRALKASHYIPYAASCGLDYLTGAGTKGGCVQGAAYTFATGGQVNFAALGLSNMATGTYVVAITNTSGSGAAKVARDATRTSAGFVVTGPAVGDVVEFVVYGALAGVATL